MNTTAFWHVYVRVAILTTVESLGATIRKCDFVFQPFKNTLRQVLYRIPYEKK